MSIQRHTVLYPTVKNDIYFDQRNQQQAQQQCTKVQQENECTVPRLPSPQYNGGASLCLPRTYIDVGFSPGDSPTATVIPKEKDKTLIRRCSSHLTTNKPDKNTRKFLTQSNHSHKFQPYVKPVKKAIDNEEEALFGDIPTLSSNDSDPDTTFNTGADILDDDMVFQEFDWITTHTTTTSINHLPLSPPLSPSDSSHDTFMFEPLDDYVLFP